MNVSSFESFGNSLDLELQIQFLKVKGCQEAIFWKQRVYYVCQNLHTIDMLHLSWHLLLIFLTTDEHILTFLAVLPSRERAGLEIPTL